MDVTGIEALIGTLTGLAIAVTGLLAAVAKLRSRDNVTDQRVDELWEFHRQRGRLRAEKNKYITNTKEESDMDTLRADLRAAYEPIAPALRELARKFTGLTDGQMIEKINAALGAWIVKHICGPLDVDSGECLEMARVVAAELPPVDPAAVRPA